MEQCKPRQEGGAVHSRDGHICLKRCGKKERASDFSKSVKGSKTSKTSHTVDFMALIELYWCISGIDARKWFYARTKESWRVIEDWLLNQQKAFRCWGPTNYRQVTACSLVVMCCSSVLYLRSTSRLQLRLEPPWAALARNFEVFFFSHENQKLYFSAHKTK